MQILLYKIKSIYNLFDLQMRSLLNLDNHNGKQLSEQRSKGNNLCNEDKKTYDINNLKESKFCLFLAIDAERTAEIINEVIEQGKLTQNSVNVLSRTANIEGLWQGTESEFHKKQIDKCFKYPPNEENEYDLYLLKITLNELEPEFYGHNPPTSRSRAFRRLLKKEHSVQISPRLPRESIENNPHLYR